MQATPGFGFFPAPSPSGSLSTDSYSPGDVTTGFADVPSFQDAHGYLQQQLQPPSQQLQFQLHELHLLVRPQSQRARVGGDFVLDAPYGGAAERRQVADPGSGGNGSNSTNGSNGRSSRSTAARKAPHPVRHRISRACDQCNQLRTKCDGQHPCLRCLSAGLICAYIRARKKRGKASRRELAQQKLTEAETAPAAPGSSSSSSEWPGPGRHGGDEGLDDLVDLCNLDGLDESLVDLDSYDVFHSSHETTTTTTTITTPSSPLPPLPPLPPSPPSLRYPVLTPVLPHLDGLLSEPAVCGLVDAYFSRAASPCGGGDPLLARLPFALDLVVRRRTVLHPTTPRACRPALLASMLWVAATATPTATESDGDSGNGQNAALCQALWALTVKLLPPAASFPLQPSVDDVVACIHLAAGTPGDDGLPWWHMAWSLARRLRAQQTDGGDHEAAEERRRVWWLAYMADRRLALQWRRPLFFLDAECVDLRQPVVEAVWRDDKETHRAHDACGPPLMASNPAGLYSTLLPLMVLVGETVDLLHTRSHPLLGSRSGGSKNGTTPWDAHATALIAQHLAVYQQSLEAARTRSPGDDETAAVFTTYATHTIGVLRNLLARGWDALQTE